MKTGSSKFKNVIDLGKAGKKLDEFEDPLVCKLCGNNDLIILDRKKDEVYCHDCNSQRELLDRSQIPEPSLVKTAWYWKSRFKDWKKGEDLTEQDLKELQETLYMTYYFDNPEKRRKLEKMCEQMQVKINDR